MPRKKSLQAPEVRNERRRKAQARRRAAMSEERKEKDRIRQKLYNKEKRLRMSEEEKAAAREKMKNLAWEKRHRMSEEEKSKSREKLNKYLMEKRGKLREEGSGCGSKDKEREKKRANRYMVITGKEYFTILKDYIQKRVKGQNEIPPLLLAKAKYNHRGLLKGKFRDRLVTESEKGLRHQLFVLCPELTVPMKERPKFAALSSLPLPIEEEYRAAWTRSLLLTLNRDYFPKGMELGAEAVELELADKVPSKIRELPKPGAENVSTENSQPSNQNLPKSAQIDPNFDLSAVKIEPEDEFDELDNMDMTFLADFDDRAEINEWMAQTAADEDKPAPKRSKCECANSLTTKASQVAAISSKVEELARIWDETYPHSGPSARAALETEWKALEIKIRAEKDEIVSSLWAELTELRAKYSEESEKTRADRMHCYYEYSLQTTWSTWEMRMDKFEEIGEKTATRKAMCGMTEEEKKAYISKQQVIRQRMERYEYQMFKLLQEALVSPSSSEQASKLVPIFSDSKFEESINYFYKRSVLKAKSPHVKVYRSKLYLLLNKVKGEGALGAEDVADLGELMNTAAPGLETHLEFKANYLKNKYKAMMDAGGDRAERERQRTNSNYRKYYHKKKYGVELEKGAYVKGPYAPYGSVKAKRGRPKKNPEPQPTTEESNSNSNQGTATVAPASDSIQSQVRRSRRSTQNKRATNEDFQWPAVFPEEEEVETNSNSNSNSVYTAQNEVPCMPQLMPQLPFNINSDVASFYNLTNAMGGFQPQFPSTSGNYYEPQMPVIEQQPTNFQQWSQFPPNIVNQATTSQHYLQNFVHTNYSSAVQNLVQSLPQDLQSSHLSDPDPEYSNNWSEEQNVSSESDSESVPNKTRRKTVSKQPTTHKRRAPRTTISNRALASEIVDNPFEAIKDKIGPELEALSKAGDKPGAAGDKPSFQAFATGEDKPAAPGEPEKRKTYNYISKTQIRQARDSSPEKMVCKVCDAVIEDYKAFVRHLVEVHYESKDNYACPFCPKSKSGRRYSRTGIRCHIKARHHQHSSNSWIMEISWRPKVAGAEHFICRHCPQLEFSSFTDLHAHVKEVHGRERYVCPICGICLRADDHWKDHVQLFHPEISPVEGEPNCSEHEPSSLFVCGHCHSEFSSQAFLSQHLEEGHVLSPSLPSVSPDRHLDKEKCERCGTIYPAAAKGKHSKENCRLHCYWCKLRLRSEDRLKEHLQKFHPNEPPVPEVLPPEDYITDPYKCEICKISYPLLSTLRIHGMMSHYLYEFMQKQKAKTNSQSEPEAVTMVTCPQPNCNSSLSPSEVHLNHVRYANLMKRYCVPCGKLIIGPGALLRHNSFVHGNKPAAPPPSEAQTEPSGPTINCPQCPESFPPSIYHATHALFKDEAVWGLEGRRPPKSVELLKNPQNSSGSSLNEGNIGQLIITTKVGARELFTCKACLKNYKTEEFLRAHILAAHQEDAFSRAYCSACNLTYANSKMLNKHRREQHAKDKKQYLCPFCELDLRKMSGLRGHVARIHPNETLNEADVKKVSITELNKIKGRHSCPVCNGAFSTPFGLKKHMERKHFPLNCHRFCDVCGLQMGNGRSVLIYHMQVYHPETEPTFLDESTAGSKRKSMLLRRCLSLSQVIELLHEVYSNLTEKSEIRGKTVRKPKTAKRTNSEESVESELESEEQSESSEDQPEPPARKWQKRIQPKRVKLVTKNENRKKRTTKAPKRDMIPDSDSEPETESEEEQSSEYEPDPTVLKRIQPKRANASRAKPSSSIGIDEDSNSGSESETDHVRKWPRTFRAEIANIEKNKRLAIVLHRCDSLVAQATLKTENVINPNLSEINEQQQGFEIVMKEEGEGDELYPFLEFAEIPENDDEMEEMEEDPLGF